MNFFKSDQESTTEQHEAMNAALGISSSQPTVPPALESKEAPGDQPIVESSEGSLSEPTHGLSDSLSSEGVEGGDLIPSDGEIAELIEHIAIDHSAGDAPKTWRDLAAEDIAAAKKRSVEVSLSSLSVTYSSEIESSRGITVLKDEELARAWLINRLVDRLNYDPKRIKLENEYVAGRGKKGTAENSVRIDVILEDEEQIPFYFIEVKAPDKYEGDMELIERQLFAVAALHESSTSKKPKFLVYYTVEMVGNRLQDKLIVIDYQKFPTYEKWTQAGMLSVSDTLNDKYARPKKPAYVRNSEKDLVSNFSPSEVKDLATRLHNFLWGGGSTGDTEVFTSLVNIILTKIQDENDTEDGKPYQFQVLQHGEVTESHESIYARLNEVYRTALKNQLGKQGDLSAQHIVNLEKFPLPKLVYAVGLMEKYSFVDGKNSLNGRDLLGDFFEQIQRDGFKQSKGQFFTPVNVVKFILYALELDNLALRMINVEQKLPLIIDPSCGSATFLIEAMKMVTNEVKQRQRSKLSTARQVQQTFSRLMPDNQEHQWARDYLYGVEHNFDLATAAKVNMVLHGDGSTNIFHKDGLKPFSAYEHAASLGSPNYLGMRAPCAYYSGKDVNGQFHVILSNPPFSVDLDGDTKKTLGKSFLFGDKKNSENLFIERYWQLLRDGGRMAIVLPESIFDTTENKYIRLFLFKFFHVRAVVSLPQLAFAPYTQTKTSILFAQKKSAAEIEYWTLLWNEQSSRFGKLSTRIQNYLKVLFEGASATSFPSIIGMTDANMRTDMAELIGVNPTSIDKTTPVIELFRDNRRAIDLALQVDTDAIEAFGRVNSNWVMREVLIKSATDAAVKGKPELDLNGEIFLAEAANIGYKRSKRGEIVQPNELFTLEVAPSRVSIKTVAVNYAKVKEDFDQRIVAAEKRSKSASLDEAIKDRAKSQLATLKASRDELDLERIRVEAALVKYYDASGALKAAHKDRTDDELRAIFELPLMMHLRSDSILLDPSKPATILDLMRSKGLWK